MKEFIEMMDFQVSKSIFGVLGETLNLHGACGIELHRWLSVLCIWMPPEAEGMCQYDMLI